MVFLKSKAWKSTLNCDNKRDATQKLHSDMHWQFYIWGRYDLVLTLKLATWMLWPCSVLTGHWAAGHRSQSQKVGKRLRLHSCDWLKPSGQPPVISHMLSSDPTMKEREPDRDDQESVEEAMGTNYSEPDRSRDMYSNGKRKWERIKVIDVWRL